MARKARQTFPGAHYHITARGNNKKTIFHDEHDFNVFIRILKNTIEKHHWLCYSYCLMNNHFHLEIETPDDNLSLGMKMLNGEFAIEMNRKRKRVGHLFQSRFHSVIIKDDSQRLNVSRYVVLNPVRAGLVEKPAQWKWSSYSATAGFTKIPSWLSCEHVLQNFHEKASIARIEYIKFVLSGRGCASPFLMESRGVL